MPMHSPSGYRRRTKIVATIGPASASPRMLARLVEAGANVFRLNFSHGTHEDHAKVYKAIRTLEKKAGRPLGVIADLQGPKLRVGTFADGKVTLEEGQRFRIDLDTTPGDAKRAPLLHPEVYQAIEPDRHLLLDDGRIRLKVLSVADDHAETEVVVGGVLSNRKGLNVPDVVLPLSALTEKDRNDLRFAVDLGVGWIALSFVQRPDDVAEARRLIDGRAQIIVKLEKPSAINSLDELIDLTDAMMVARGDLGVEMPPEEVPRLQKRIVRECRRAGKPVIVATQMLDSMVGHPTPTRAEASDVATAVYDGADAVMLSAETAAGEYPVEAVTMMNRIAVRTELDPLYRRIMDAAHPEHEMTAADAITGAAAMVAATTRAAAIVTYTTTGSTTLRAARERPSAPILCLTSRIETARRMALVWGVVGVHTEDVRDFPEMVQKACAIALRDGLAEPGQRLVITAGVPFGTPGATNVLRLAWIDG